MTIEGRLRKAARAQPYRLLFATISGAHLYGFPSADSDYDLRGVHLLPLDEVVGLDTGPETIESSSVTDGFELDLVTHDARKFVRLLLTRNGYVLEQLYSPLTVITTERHEELMALTTGCITTTLITTSASPTRSGGCSRRPTLSSRCCTPFGSSTQEYT